MTDAVIDGNGLFARAWFAVSSSGGDENEAHRACVMSLLGALGRLGEPIDRMLVCWDDGQKKDKGRKEKPVGYHEGIKRFQDTITTLFGPCNYSRSGYEADDLVGTAAKQSEADRVYVISGDKDLAQLHGGNVSYYYLRDKCVLSTHTICEKWKVKKPEQISIALAIKGDSVDAIPGVSRYGAKKCEALFQKVSKDMSLEEAIIAVIAQMPEDKVDEFWESFELTMLNVDIEGVPDPVEVSFAPIEEVEGLGLDYDVQNAYVLFTEGSAESVEEDVEASMAFIDG